MSHHAYSHYPGRATNRPSPQVIVGITAVVLAIIVVGGAITCALSPACVGAVTCSIGSGCNITTA